MILNDTCTKKTSLILIFTIFLGKKIKGGDELEWKDKLMDIPALPLTTNSKFIDVKYYVRVHLDIPMAIDMEFKLPITMCSVPFKPTYQDAPLERQTRFSEFLLVEAKLYEFTAHTFFTLS